MKPRLQLLGSSAARSTQRPGQTSQVSAVIPFARPPPSVPSCSRWFSCSCCHRREELRPTNYFTPKSGTVEVGGLAAEQQGRKPSLSRSALSQSAKITYGLSVSPGNSAWSINANTLPPPLPYSPGSIPFRRQLDALTYAVQTSAPGHDTSWSIFQSIHPSLRSHVPRQTLLHLVKQLSRHDWDRIVEVFEGVNDFGDFAKTISVDKLQSMYKYGAERLLSKLDSGDEDPSACSADFGILRKLWRLLLQSRSERMGQSEPQVRLVFLQLCRHELQGSGMAMLVLEDLVSLLENGGAADIGLPFRDVLLDIPHNSETLPSLVKLICRAWHERNRISDVVMCDLLREARKLDLEQYTLLTHKLRSLCKDHRVYLRVRDCLASVDDARRGSRFSETDVHIFLAKPATSEQAAIDMTEACLRRARLAQSWQESVPWLSAAVDCSGRLMQIAHRGGQLSELHSAVVDALDRFQRSALSDSAVEGSKDLKSGEEAIMRFCDYTSTAKQTYRLPINLASQLFLLAIRTSLDTREIRPVRQLYAHIRAVPPPKQFRWKEENRLLWHKLLVRNLRPPMPSSHFAMRLHADALTDGLAIPAADILSSIRASRYVRGFSRNIITKRYITDYLALPSTDAGDRGRLIDAVTSAVCTGHNTPEGLPDAIRRVVKLCGPNPLPKSAAIKMIIYSTQRCHISHLRLLQPIILRTEQSKDIESNRYLFHFAMKRVLSDAHREPFPGLSRVALRAKLQIASQLYEKMLDSGIRPNGDTASIFIRALAREEPTVSRAVQVFQATVSAGELPHINTVRELLSRLYEVDQQAAATGIKRVWQEAGGLMARLPEPKPKSQPPIWAEQMAERSGSLTSGLGKKVASPKGRVAVLTHSSERSITIEGSIGSAAAHNSQAEDSDLIGLRVTGGAQRDAARTAVQRPDDEEEEVPRMAAVGGAY